MFGKHINSTQKKTFIGVTIHIKYCLSITVGAAPAIINPSRVDGPGDQYPREENYRDLQ